jgi:hypothetical protein
MLDGRDFATSVPCAPLPLGSAHAASAANDRKVRTTVTRRLKMLRNARMAGLVKLHCGMGTVGTRAPIRLSLFSDEKGRLKPIAS